MQVEAVIRFNVPDGHGDPPTEDSPQVQFIQHVLGDALAQIRAPSDEAIAALDDNAGLMNLDETLSWSIVEGTGGLACEVCGAWPFSDIDVIQSHIARFHTEGGHG